MKLYVDVVKLSFTPRAIWLTIVVLLDFIAVTLNELRLNRQHYKYEWTAGDWEQERKASLKESIRRFKKHERLEMAK